jgi:hypothetical protein
VVDEHDLARLVGAVRIEHSPAIRGHRQSPHPVVDSSRQRAEFDRSTTGEIEEFEVIDEGVVWKPFSSNVVDPVAEGNETNNTLGKAIRIKK